MSAQATWRAVQAAIGTAPDGIPGKNDAAALEAVKEAALAEYRASKAPVAAERAIKGRGLTVFVSGDDLIMRNVRCTCFGGTADPQDNGDTASGVSTKDPATLGCALPRDYHGASAATRRALEGSPIPEKLPWGTKVEITQAGTGAKLTVPFIDLGPNLEQTSNGCDLTVAAAKHFNPAANARNFEMMCDVRIIGGARYV